MRKHIKRIVLVVLLATSALATVPVGTVSASQQAPTLSSGSGINQEMGFDTCALPSPSDMENFWVGTPLYWYNVYIGGKNYSCRNDPGPTASWLNTVSAQGWSFLFNWVGLQSPCSTQNVYTFSTDPATAKQQGWTEGQNAWTTLINNLGITNLAQGTAIVYDLDSAPDQNNPGCLAATNAFIQGWVNYFHAHVPMVVGVYGSVCGSNLVALASLSPPPDFIWGAWWNSNPSTSNLDAGCGIPSSDWVNHQRFKQYEGSHYQSYNGTTLQIDSDCANGPTDPNGTSLTNQSCL